MIMKIAGPAVVVTLVALSYAHQTSHLAEVAKANKLSPEETAAFEACSSQTSRMRITFSKGRDSTTSNVPESVCVCQARVMVRVFKPGEYRDHGRVTEYMIKKTGTQELDASHIQPGEGSASSQFARLVGTFNACSDRYGDEVFARMEDKKRK